MKEPVKEFLKELADLLEKYDAEIYSNSDEIEFEYDYKGIIGQSLDEEKYLKFGSYIDVAKLRNIIK